MATAQELIAVINQVTAHSGDPNAWMRGLSQDEVGTAVRITASPAELDSLIAKIRANHPTLFERTAAPDEHRGASAAAMTKAEHDLAQQNSSTAQLDLMVIAAILNAHTTTRVGAEALTALQRDIENAVHARTDLDTPAGARDFQRYLIGKLRQIGAIVETVSLDDTSKAGLAGAWTALYESSKGGATAATPPPTGDTAPGALAAPAVPLPAYGAELGAPLPEPWPIEPAPAPPAPVVTQHPAPAAATPPTVPSLPGGGLAGGGAPAPIGAPVPLPRLGDGADEPVTTSRTEPTDLGLEDLLAEDLLPEEPEADRADLADEADEADEEDEEDEAKDEPAPEGEAESLSTEVRIPGGDTVTAATPQLASAIRATLAGTPIGTAFHQQGIAIPPPGTTVPNPVDPGRITTGDIGMFTDRQALALDRERALVNGRIQPVTAVSGPSFLGWLHPPEPGTRVSTGTESPAPTRPASVAGNAG